jgi:amidase
MDSADLVFAGIARQAEMVASGDVSPIELVEACLDRIERLNPQLNAFRVVLAEQARAEARQAEGRRGAGGDRPLLGVPIAIKDDADVAGEITAFGTGAQGGPAYADCEMVRRLREAGAIVIGKTNVPELTIWPWTETQTWGITRNPWDASLTPGGSSGGSASAVASGMVGAATASDGLGSIRIPAACCGLFGLKPQRDRVSLRPRVGEWHGLAHYGTLTRSVRDTALFLDAVADRPPAEPFSAAAARSPGKLRIALSFKIPSGLIAPVHSDVKRVTNEAADLLRSLGHDVVQRDPGYSIAATRSSLARYFRGIRDDAAELPHPEKLEKRTKGMARAGRLVSDRALQRTLDKEPKFTEQLNEIFRDVDVVLTPVLARPPLRADALRGKGAIASFNAAGRFVPFPGPWNVTGQPAATVPAGQAADGFPLCVQIVGRPDDEATLLSLAAQMEAERPWADRRPPIS